MGAKSCMLVYSNGDVAASLKKSSELDREKTELYVKQLFPEQELSQIEDTDLFCIFPPENTIHAGCFGDVFIVAYQDFGVDYPSKLANFFVNKKLGHTLHLHAMHSGVDWFAFAVWHNGELVRSLSLSPDHGIIEDIGHKLAFEIQYWEGRLPGADAEDFDEEDYPLPFHPLELGEAALSELFGFILEGTMTDDLIEPEDFPLLAYQCVKKPWWKRW